MQLQDLVKSADIEQVRRYVERCEAMKSPDRLMAWLDDAWKRPRHIAFMGDILSRVAEGNQRIILQCSVRHGKSWLASHALPVWFLEMFPDKFVGLATYQANFAARWGRRVRNTFKSNEDMLQTRIADDSGAAHSWETSKGGGMHTAGVGGEFTGRGFHLSLIDDPIKGWEDANSELQRENAWDWYQSTFRTRLEPNGSIVLIMARWHEDDLTGRLLKQMEDGDGERWDVIDLPATAMDSDSLGRKKGEPLWPERYDLDTLAVLRKAVGRRAWQALYQQSPRPEDGNRYNRSWFRYAKRCSDGFYLPQSDGNSVKVFDKDLVNYGVADLAQTAKTESDFTARGIISVTKNHDIIIKDIWHAQADSPTVSRVLRGDYDRFDLASMAIEDAHWGKTLIQQFQVEGLAVKPMRPGTQDKIARSGVAEDMMGAGKIYFLDSLPNLNTLESELLAFPNGAHDDLVDMVAYAARLVANLQVPGVVYAEFADDPVDSGGHIVPDISRIPKDCKPYLLVQPGAITGALLCFVDHEDTLIVASEIYIPHSNCQNLCDALGEMLGVYKVDRKKDRPVMMLDPDAVYMRQREVGVTAGELSGMGWPMAPWMEMEQETMDSRARGLFSDKQMLICEGCVNLRNELRNYRRKLDRDGLPMDRKYAGMNYLIRPLRAFSTLAPTSKNMKASRSSIRR